MCIRDRCQETAGCKGCTVSGVCGKTPDVAAMQDLLVYVTKGISAVTTALRRENRPVPSRINHLIAANLFTTITNVNFDKEDIIAGIRTALDVYKRQIRRCVGHGGPDFIQIGASGFCQAFGCLRRYAAGRKIDD